METEILFQEVQSFGKKQVQLFFKLITGVLITALAINIFMQKGQINSVTTILFWALIVSVIAAIFTTFKMITQIRTDGIYIKYLPVQPWFSKYLWKDITEVYVREYNAITEYFGWGIKVGPMGKAYILSGDIGIQIFLQNNSKILIGTQQPDKVREVLSSLQLI